MYYSFEAVLPSKKTDWYCAFLFCLIFSDCLANASTDNVGVSMILIRVSVSNGNSRPINVLLLCCVLKNVVVDQSISFEFWLTVIKKIQMHNIMFTRFLLVCLMTHGKRSPKSRRNMVKIVAGPIPSFTALFLRLLQPADFRDWWVTLTAMYLLKYPQTL